MEVLGIILAVFIGTLIGAAFGIPLGYRIGAQTKQQFQKAKDNSIQIQTSEILLDAKSNKEISDIAVYCDTSPKKIALNELVKMINEAAQNGQSFINIENDINSKIEKYFTKKEIKDYFSSHGYKIQFMYDILDCSRIEKISWED